MLTTLCPACLAKRWSLTTSVPVEPFLRKLDSTCDRGYLTISYDDVT